MRSDWSRLCGVRLRRLVRIARRLAGGRTEGDFVRALSRGARALKHQQIDLGLLDRTYKSIRAAARKLDRPGHCFWPGCTHQSIKYSHTISRAIGLAPIAVDGRVETPERFLRRVEPHSAAIPKASTFPGYCRKHEQEFSPFEGAGKLSTPNHYLLQAVRSADREVWWGDARASFLAQFNSSHREQIDAVSDPRRRRSLRRKVLRPIEFIGVSSDMSRAGVRFVRHDLREALKHPDVLPLFVHAFQDVKGDPVALSGSIVHWYEDREGTRRPAEFVFSAHPNAGGRLMILASSRDEVDTLNSYIASEAFDAAARTRLIRTWMHHTDHWFANRTWWQSSSERFRKAVLDAGRPFIVPSPPDKPEHRAGA